MNILKVHLPSGAKVSGQLRRHPQPDDLSQDIYQVELPNNIFIHVGWLPEYDPNGQYLISVFRDTLEEPLQEPKWTRDLSEVQREIELAAFAFGEMNLA